MKYKAASCCSSCLLVLAVVRHLSTTQAFVLRRTSSAPLPGVPPPPHRLSPTSRPLISYSNSRRAGRHAAALLPSIPPSDTWGNIAALCGSATVAQIVGRHTQLGRLLGPPVTAMALVFGLASVGILNPGGTAASHSLQWLALQFATPLLLLGADLQDCVPRCGPLLPSFLAASTATVVACMVGWQASSTRLIAALGAKDALVIAAALLAKNIGGGINYIAVCQSLGASPPAVAAGLVVDNLFALLYFPATSILSAGLPDVEPNRATTTTTTTDPTVDPTAPSSQNDVFQTCNLLFLSSALLWLGEKVGGRAGALPCCTLLTLAVAVLSPARWTAQWKRQAETLGATCLYLFFATAGAPGMAMAESVHSAVGPLSVYLSCLYGIHFAILWTLHRFMGQTFRSFVPQRLLVASSAAIGGPATAIALAQANQWPSLVVPSCLVGNVGYAIATFCGLAFAHLFRHSS